MRSFSAGIAVLLTLVLAPAAFAAAGDIDLVSRADGANGAGGNASSQLPAVNAAGTKVAFTSAATNLTADGAPAGVTQAYVRDLSAGTTILASRAAAPANAAVTDAGLSDDGRYVVFGSRATNLGATAANIDRVYVRDTVAGTTTIVYENAVRPAISADGSTIVFCANANIPGTGASGASLKVYAYTLATGAYDLVSRADGASGSPLTGDQPSLSADGRYVAFQGQGGTAQVWVRDRQGAATVLASRASGTAGAQANAASIEPDISADGRYVVFRSSATNLSDDDVDTSDDIFERDLAAGTTTLVSRADGATGAGGTGDADLPSVSDDGTRVFFRCRCANFSATDNDNGDNGWVRDTVAGTTTWVHGHPGQPAPQGVMNGLALSGNGRYAVYASNATLTADETGTFSDVFRRDLGAPPPPPPPPVASLSADQSLTEASTSLTFTVTLSAASAQPVVIDWATADGTALTPGDYRAGFGQVTFAPGETSKSFTVDVVGDDIVEPDETFSVALSHPQNATLGRASAVVTIRNDDVAPPPTGTPTPTNPGPAPTPAPLPPPTADCATQVTAQLVRLQGCFTSKDLKLDLGSVTLQASQQAVATGKVTMNGLQIVPDDAKTKITVTPRSISSDGSVSVYAGDIRVHHDDLALALPDGTDKDKITPDKGFEAQIGDTAYGMALGGDLSVTFGRDGSSQIVGPILLPAQILDIKGLEALKKELPTVNMTLHTTLAKGLDKNTISASKDAIALGPVQLKHVSLAYEQLSDTWTGSAKVELPTPNRLLVGAGLSFQHGSFKSAYAEVDHLNLQMTPALYLQRIKLGFGVNPLTLLGGIGVSGGPLVNGVAAVRVDGDFSFAFPYQDKPAKLRIDGTLQLANLQVASAFLEYLSSGSVTFGGALKLGLPDTAPANFDKQPVQLQAFLNGFVDQTGFDVEVGASVNVLGKAISAQLLASSKGMAACGQVFFVSAGFGYAWDTKQLTIMGPFVCDVGPWRVFAGKAQAGPQTLHLGDGATIVRLTGAGGPPKVVLHGPGQTVTVPAGTAPVGNDDWFVMQDANTTYIGLHHPKGDWTVEPQAGSPAITSISGADVLPAPRVKARVKHDRITYTIAPRAGQKVTFLEMGPQTKRALGVAKGSKGALRFTPGAGPGGTRKIVALVEQNGIPRKQLTVATYRAPGPPAVARVKNVTVTAKGDAVTVRVKPGKGAVARWEVLVHFPSGSTSVKALKPRGGSVRLTDVLPAKGARVRVWAQSADLRQGKVMTAKAR